MSGFETETLTQAGNRSGLMDLSGKWIDQVSKRRQDSKLILDLDASVGPIHGHQEGNAFNGHLGCSCCHPFFCFNKHGDLDRAMLRKGDVHNAEEWRAVLEPVKAASSGKFQLVAKIWGSSLSRKRFGERRWCGPRREPLARREGGSG